MAFKYKFFHWASSLSILRRESRKELEIRRKGIEKKKLSEYEQDPETQLEKKRKTGEKKGE